MSNRLVISLHQADNAGMLGTKGWNLYLLSRNGFNVPMTYCITNAGYKQFIAENKLDKTIGRVLRNGNLTTELKSEIIRNAILDSGIQMGLSSELINHNLLTTGLKFAIRSSSNFEDLQDASFAGLYDSFLDIHDMTNILASIKKCWASLWSARAIAYRDRHRLDHMQAEMSVIIQPMVNALYSGVCFTENPIEADGKMHIEYCEGLGDNILSGRIAPYSCSIVRADHTVLYSMSPANNQLGDETIRRLSDTFQDIEDLFECPQDIEWAMTADNLYILQTRPVINKRPPLSLDQIWTRANIGEVLPNVITPLTWDVFRATLSNKAISSKNTRNAIEDGQDGIRLICGRGYLRLDVMLDSFCYLPAVTPLVMNRALGVNITDNLDGYSRPSGLPVRLAQTIFLLDSMKLLPRLRLMVSMLPPLSGVKSGTIDETMKWTARCFRLHIKATAYAIGAYGLLIYLLNRWMPAEAERLLPEILLGREDMQTSVQGTSLWQLAEYVQADPALALIFKYDPDITLIEQHMSKTESGRNFLGMFQSFLDANGARAAGELELSIPRWRESPLFVWGVLRKYLRSGIETSRDISTSRSQRRHEAMSHIRASLTAFRWNIFSRILSSYSEFVTCRENLKYRLIEGFEKIRGSLLAIGRSMADNEVLDDVDDIFFLRATEVFAFINYADSTSKKELVLKRKEQFELWKTQDVSEILLGDDQEDTFNQLMALRGIGCSPGIAKGFARVLFDTSEIADLKPGEILVAPHTDPGWTPLFLICGGLVTEIGGFLSHGATVAREYGIPAVVNVHVATKRIRTGDFIRVDGTVGSVQVLEKA